MTYFRDENAKIEMTVKVDYDIINNVFLNIWEYMNVMSYYLQGGQAGVHWSMNLETAMANKEGTISWENIFLKHRTNTEIILFAKYLY